MVTIKDLRAREILDSKDDPTIEAEICLSDGTMAKASVPSGVSRGTNEVLELRDNDFNRYQGLGVLKACENINSKIKKVLQGKDASDQKKVDQLMIELDGTKNKGKLGANAILAVSLVVCRAYALSMRIELYEYFGKLIGTKKFILPQPLILMAEGGKHGEGTFDLQEIFVVLKSDKFRTFSDKFQKGNKLFQTVGEILKEKGYKNSIGLEGAFSPRGIKSNTEIFEIILDALKKNSLILENDVVLGLDLAANSFFKNGKYELKEENLNFSPQEWLDYLTNLSRSYPIWSFEDPFFENDWESWIKFRNILDEKKQIVGDDLITTNINRIKMASKKNAINAVIMKPNQVGTISETLQAIKFCQELNLIPIISHRAGETNDDLIADLCVGTGCPQCKFGGFRQNERLVKYLRLLDIEEKLQSA